MGSVLLTWLALAILLVGAGLLLLRVLGCRRCDADRMAMAFWTGLAMTVALLQVWHLWLPVGWAPLFLLAAPAAAGYAWSVGAVREWMARRHDPLAAALMLCAVVWCANRAIGPGDFFDSGLYHHSVVRWNETHAIVPGLANLNLRFGFNNASHLLVAALDQGPWDGRANHLGNGLLLAAASASTALGAARLLRGRGAASDAALVALAPALALVAIGKEASSPSTDFPAAVALWLAAWRLTALATEPSPEAPASDVAFVAWSAAMATCFKLSAVLLGAATSAAALCVWILLHRPGSARFLRCAAAVAAAWLFLCGPWVARSSILSGYPAYPSTALPLPADWRVPEWRVNVQQDAIESWARLKYAVFVTDRLSRSRFAPLARHLALPEEPLRGMRWVRPWLLAQAIAAPAAVLMPLVLGAAAWICWLLRRRRRVALDWRALCLFPGFLGLVAWFALAPEPRFGYAVAWSLLAVSAGLIAWSLGPAARGQRVLALACLALTVPVMAHQGLARRMAERDAPASRIPFLGPGPDQGFHPHPAGDVITFTTRCGLLLNVPAGAGNQVWDAPLPATDQPDRNLCQRRPGDLSGGFAFPRRATGSGASSPP
jgi:hypothetical protein